MICVNVWQNDQVLLLLYYTFGYVLLCICFVDLIFMHGNRHSMRRYTLLVLSYRTFLCLKKLLLFMVILQTSVKTCILKQGKDKHPNTKSWTLEFMKRERQFEHTYICLPLPCFV